MTHVRVPWLVYTETYVSVQWLMWVYNDSCDCTMTHVTVPWLMCKETWHMTHMSAPWLIYIERDVSHDSCKCSMRGVYMTRVRKDKWWLYHPIYIPINICIYVSVYVYIYINIYIFIYIYVWVLSPVRSDCVYIYIQRDCRYIWVYAYICIYIYIWVMSHTWST